MHTCSNSFHHRYWNMIAERNDSFHVIWWTNVLIGFASSTMGTWAAGHTKPTPTRIMTGGTFPWECPAQLTACRVPKSLSPWRFVNIRDGPPEPSSSLRIPSASPFLPHRNASVWKRWLHHTLTCFQYLSFLHSVPWAMDGRTSILTLKITALDAYFPQFNQAGIPVGPLPIVRKTCLMSWWAVAVYGNKHKCSEGSLSGTSPIWENSTRSFFPSGSQWHPHRCLTTYSTKHEFLLCGRLSVWPESYYVWQSCSVCNTSSLSDPGSSF